MTEERPVFPPPPRAPGPGGRRRRRLVIGWCAGGAIGIAFLLFLARHTERTSIETRRLAAEGRRSPCTVVSKRIAGGKSKSYYVRLSIDAPPYRATVERSLPRGIWDSVTPGSTSTWYHDPGRPFDDGVCELERASKESMSGYYVSLALAGAAAVAVIAAVTFLRRRMRLLIHGTEVRVFDDGRLPHARANLIQLRSGAFVALASPDPSRRFFPDLRDVALDRLLEGIPAPPPVLPKTPREALPAWERWIRRRYSGYGFGVGIAALVGLGALAGIAFSDQRAGFGTITATSWTVAVLLLLAWRRGVARERRLWREGAEVHAALLRISIVKQRAGYDLGFLDGRDEVRFHASLPRHVPLRDVPVPEEAPVRFRRVVALVDPARPRRVTLVPFEVAPR